MTSFLITYSGFAVAMVLAYVAARLLTGAARTLALRWGVMSEVTARSSHAVPTPRLGGAGLALGFALGCAVFLGILRWLPGYMGEDPEAHALVGYHPALLFWVAMGWLGMLATGLLDDLFDLPAVLKLMLMTLAALAPIVFGDVRLTAGQPGWMASSWHGMLGGALALGWVLFFTNAYNFMDGMDGFAANFARIAATALFFGVLAPGLFDGSIARLRGEAYLLPILAMACWGFLHWNRPPAKIFMGDGGSLSIGYVLSVFALLGEQGRFQIHLPLAVSLTILMPFVFDVTLTLFRRARRGENILKAHREHLYQRLMRTGLTHSRVLGMNLRIFIMCAVLSLFGQILHSELFQWFGLMGAVLVMLHYWRTTLERESAAAALENVAGGGEAELEK